MHITNPQTLLQHHPATQQSTRMIRFVIVKHNIQVEFLDFNIERDTALDIISHVWNKRTIPGTIPTNSIVTQHCCSETNQSINQERIRVTKVTKLLRDHCKPRRKSSTNQPTYRRLLCLDVGNVWVSYGNGTCPHFFQLPSPHHSIFSARSIPAGSP